MESRRKGERLLPRLAPISGPNTTRHHRLTAQERVWLAAPRLCHGVAVFGQLLIAFVSRMLTTFPILEVLGLAALIFLLGR